jgi:hypothetical protein
VTKRFNLRNFRFWGKGAMALAAISAFDAVDGSSTGT